jgi:tetratricopeptide (TPR) repeat protein
MGRVGEHQQARRELEQLLASAADDGEKIQVLVALSYIDRNAGKSLEAAQRLQGALSSGLSSGRVYAALARCLAASGKERDAIRAWKRALQLSPRDTGYRLEMARFLEGRGQRAEAAAELREALRISPEDPDCSSYLGYLYAMEGINLEEAGRLVSLACKRNPLNGSYLAAQGWLMFRRGRVREAHRLLEVAALRTGSARVYDHLGDSCFALGYWREARLAWLKAVELDPDMTVVKIKLKRLKAAKVK